MPIDSLYPRLDIPEIDVFGLLFERKDRPFPDDKVIFVDNDTGRSYTYAQTKAASIDFGKGLVAAWEWQRGDVLATYMANTIDVAPVTWGTHWAGGVVSPANPNYTVEELVYQLKDCGAKGLVTQLASLDKALAAAAKVGIPADRVILAGDERDPTRAKHFTSVRTTSGTSRYRRAKRKPSDLAFLVYSSGTTGLPKGVMLSHRNIVANVLQLFAAEGDLSWQGGPDGQGDKILAFLPFFHIYGLTCCLHQALWSGWTLVVMSAFAIDKWCAAVQQHRITFSYVVPPVVLQLSKHECVDNYDLRSLRMLNSGAAPLTYELVEACSSRIDCPIKQGYGLSETSPTTHTQPWSRWKSTVGSVGTMMPNMSAKVVAEGSDDEVPVGKAGEIWLKGPNIFMGYLNNEAGTKNALTQDGYFKTGDVGYVDRDGNFYITDRVKELIKYKGFQVPPAELEGILLAHPALDDAAVLGLYSDAQATELPRAYVVVKKDKPRDEKTAKEIADFVSAKVAPHKRLRGGVFFVDEIPKSASGKILRRVLKTRALEEEEKKNKTIKAKL